MEVDGQGWAHRNERVKGNLRFRLVYCHVQHDATCLFDDAFNLVTPNLIEYLELN